MNGDGVNDPQAGSSQLYSGYADWKNWRGEFAPSDREARYFAAELADIPLAGKRVLEIGFGNGSFLAWAKSLGAEVVGTEIDAVMIEHARARGFDARPASLEALAAANERFDLVVAFDVLEHWDKPTLVASLTQLAGLLHSGGQVLARFPNGQSPFGRVHQYGDLTHRTVLSASSILQLANMTDFVVVRVGNASSVPVRRDFFSVLKHHWRRFRRARFERWLGKLYGFGRLALDPNLVVLLRRLDKPSTNRTDRITERT
jgi:2-polyprenyl-3-methyl-5-hydroxy-6-metoxy-1,4-benzoquinol methylase